MSNSVWCASPSLAHPCTNSVPLPESQWHLLLSQHPSHCGWSSQCRHLILNSCLYKTVSFHHEVDAEHLQNLCDTKLCLWTSFVHRSRLSNYGVLSLWSEYVFSHISEQNVSHCNYPALSLAACLEGFVSSFLSFISSSDVQLLLLFNPVARVTEVKRSIQVIMLCGYFWREWVSGQVIILVSMWQGLWVYINVGVCDMWVTVKQENPLASSANTQTCFLFYFFPLPIFFICCHVSHFIDFPFILLFFGSSVKDFSVLSCGTASFRNTVSLSVKIEKL